MISAPPVPRARNEWADEARDRVHGAATAGWDGYAIGAGRVGSPERVRRAPKREPQ